MERPSTMTVIHAMLSNEALEAVAGGRTDDKQEQLHGA